PSEARFPHRRTIMHFAITATFGPTDPTRANSRRFMSAPKHRRHHLIGSNEHFERGSISAPKPLPQYTADVAEGSTTAVPRMSAVSQLHLNEQTSTKKARSSRQCPSASSRARLMPRLQR